MIRRYFWLCMLVMLSGRCWGQTKFKVDLDVGWDGYHRPMKWMPVEIGITSPLKEPFEGTLSISAPQDDLTTMVVQDKFVLTPEVPLRFLLSTKMAYEVNDCVLEITDAEGKTAWTKKYAMTAYGGKLKTVRKEDLLIGLVGRKAFGLSLLDVQATCAGHVGKSGRIHVGQKLPRRLPVDWTGYACLDLLVLCDPDWRWINAHRSKAIAEWVANGGRVLVVLGSRPLPRDHVIAGLLPVRPGKGKTVILDPAERRKWRCRDKDVACWPLEDKEGARLIHEGRWSGRQRLFAVGLVGFGQVAAIGFDPSALAIARPRDRGGFWAGMIEQLLSTANSRELPSRTKITILPAPRKKDQITPSPGDMTYEAGPEHEAVAGVMDYLQSIPELQPISIWWVVLLLVLLAVLLGPVDYFVLRRLGRLPLTWITSAAWVTLFTVGACIGVQMVRGGPMRLRVVSVIDGISGGQARSTTYAGLFAPDSDVYRLDGLGDDEWWSAMSKRKQETHMGGLTDSTRRLTWRQHDGANVPSILPINIWTMQCLVGESPAKTTPFSAAIEFKGETTVLTVTNGADRAIEGGYVLFTDPAAGSRGGLWQVTFNAVPPRATQTFRFGRGQWTENTYWSPSRREQPARPSPPDPWMEPEADPGVFVSRFNSEIPYFAAGCVARTRGIMTYLRHGAAVVCARYDDAPLGCTVADRGYKSSHVRLVRLVVFPREGAER